MSDASRLGYRAIVYGQRSRADGSYNAGHGSDRMFEVNVGSMSGVQCGSLGSEDGAEFKMFQIHRVARNVLYRLKDNALQHPQR